MDKSSLGDRMKGYEHVSRNVLTRRTPVILRVDGRAFHTYTKKMGFDKPYDKVFHVAMTHVASTLMKEIQGAKLAYGQSDEISVLITDYDTLQTDAWFGYSVQKMASVAASIATVAFEEYRHLINETIRSLYEYPWAQFDARVFSIPKEEVANYFVWRQQDATRNSISMLAQTHFSHKQLHGVSCNEMQEMLMTERGINWNDVETYFKRGFCIHRSGVDREIPIFTEDRGYVENLVYLDEPLSDEGSSR